MSTLADRSKNKVTSENPRSLQKFIDAVKHGKITPFKEKTERARKNLKRAGLIK